MKCCKPFILCVSHSAQLYGSERSLVDFVVDSKDVFDLLVLVPGDGPLVDVLRSCGIPFYQQNHKAWIGKEPWLLRVPYRLFVNVTAFFVVRRMLAKTRIPKIIYSNTISKPLGALLSLSLGLPHIWHVREFVKEGLGLYFDFGESNTMAFINKTTSRMICNSKTLQKEMSKKIPNKKIDVIYNGVLSDRQVGENNYRERSPLNEKLVTLCIVGRLGAIKGQSYAISCVKMLKDSGVKSLLRVVGDGDKISELKLRQQAIDLGVEKEVIFEGFQSDVKSILAESDICLICSKKETFGRVAVESMSVGTPVIATNSGGIPEIITDKVDGLLYPYGDIKKLFENILLFIKDDKLYTGCSLIGYHSVYSKFTRIRYVEDMQNVIKKTLEDHLDKNSS